MRIFFKKSFFLFVLFVLFNFSASSLQAATELKLALLAPEGSTWAKVMHDWDKELTQLTQGRVKFKFYFGGVMGDERDVIRKMRYGQVHMSAFTGLGLGVVNPEMRILELPFLAQTYDEIDKISAAFQPKLEAGFKKRGFTLLAWNETGFVHVFSNKPVKSLEDMKGMKWWAWDGDPLVEALYKEVGITPIPLSLPDVYTSLQTNLIDAVYSTPLAVLALQWSSRVKYISDVKLTHASGGILISNNAYKMLSAADRSVLEKTAKKYSQILLTRIRSDNEKSYTVLKEQGLKFVSIPPAELKRIQEKCIHVWDQLAGKLYSKEMLAELKAFLQTLRK